MLILDPSLRIEKALIRNSDFEELSEVRKWLLEEEAGRGKDEIIYQTPIFLSRKSFKKIDLNVVGDDEDDARVIL